jgi:hypothetical protein
VETVTQNQQFCSVKKRALQKIDRVYGAVCPFCGIELPPKRRAVFVEVGDDGNAIRSRAVPLKPFWKRNSTIVAIAAFAVFLSWVAIDARIDSSDSGSPTVVTQGATDIVDSTLLGDGNYTGSGSYAVYGARKAYSSEHDASAVAARISVPGEESLCLFWYMGGRSQVGGDIIGDTVTRAFSVWGEAATAGSPADDQVRALKKTDEGTAVVAASAC